MFLNEMSTIDPNNNGGSSGFGIANVPRNFNNQMNRTYSGTFGFTHDRRFSNDIFQPKINNYMME